MESGALTYHTPGGTAVFPAGSAGMVNANVLHMTESQPRQEKNVQLLHIFEPALLAGNHGSTTSRRQWARSTEKNGGCLPLSLTFEEPKDYLAVVFYCVGDC